MITLVSHKAAEVPHLPKNISSNRFVHCIWGEIHLMLLLVED